MSRRQGSPDGTDPVQDRPCLGSQGSPDGTDPVQDRPCLGRHDSCRDEDQRVRDMSRHLGSPDGTDPDQDRRRLGRHDSCRDNVYVGLQQHLQRLLSAWSSRHDSDPVAAVPLRPGGDAPQMTVESGACHDTLAVLTAPTPIFADGDSVDMGPALTVVSPPTSRTFRSHASIRRGLQIMLIGGGTWSLAMRRYTS
jgi:hypothetical protein